MSNYGTGGDASKRGERDMDEPAATITSKADRMRWRAAKVMGSGMVERHGDRPGRNLTEPAFTIRGSAGGMEPGGFRLGSDSEKLRLTIHEAAILQSYPEGFEFVGTKGKQFLQVGNAVPPLLALACIEAAWASAEIKQEKAA